MLGTATICESIKNKWLDALEQVFFLQILVWWQRSHQFECQWSALCFKKNNEMSSNPFNDI